MTLRRAGAKDADAIAALTREAYAKWVDVFGREPLPMQVDYREALKRHRFDLLEQDGELVALIETAGDGDHLLIVNIAVRPNLQAFGYGSMLLRWAESLAVDEGLTGLRLYTNKLARENVRFYERRGFAIEREAPLNGVVAVYLVKPIAEQI